MAGTQAQSQPGESEIPLKTTGQNWRGQRTTLRRGLITNPVSRLADAKNQKAISHPGTGDITNHTPERNLTDSAYCCTELLHGNAWLEQI
ncbi:hypothetical protein BaRGS_00033960 [Batillaria attramentaria]|uniref:Uncharacterized protein n=1 Tax=Batillaria attramentaria TaxID=370345 RepID=A0ABD0JIW3_9CAEN